MFEKLQKTIAEQLNVDLSKVKPEAKFKEDLNADSLDLFELIMASEEEYSIEIPAEDLEKMITVSDVCDYLSEKGVA